MTLPLCARCATPLFDRDVTEFVEGVRQHTGEDICIARTSHEGEEECECGHCIHQHSVDPTTGKWNYCWHCTPKEHKLIYDDDEAWDDAVHGKWQTHWFCLSCEERGDECETSYHTVGPNVTGEEFMYCNHCDHAGPFEDTEHWSEMNTAFHERKGN